MAACRIATKSAARRAGEFARREVRKSGEKRVKSGGIRPQLEPVRFDGFVLDRAGRQLTRDGEVLHLTPKAFDLLALLIDQAPRVVAKTELHERLWPDTFVSDSTLLGVVKELRRVLADRLADRPIIRTAHRVGYAFCRPLEPAARARSAVLHWLLVDERRIALRAGENMIGRDPAAIVRLDSTAVSRCHARIVVDGPNVRLTDLGSKNGTTVGERRVTDECSLQDGDIICVGTTRLLYRAAATAGSTETLGPSER